MNKIFLIGRLTRDPELRYTGSNVPVATFSLAVNRNFSNQDGEREADFINIVVWKKSAENCKNYLSQGSQCAVEGRLQIRNYEDQDGNKKYISEVIAESVEFLTKKQNENNQVAENSDLENSNPYADFGEQIEITDEDLPF